MSRVEILTYGHDGTPRVIVGEPGFGCFVECEYTEPPSIAGRKVDVYIPSEVIAPLMKELRRIAIRDRNKTMADHD